MSAVISERDRLAPAGKPVMVFGLTRGGDPLHPLTLSYATPLVRIS